MIKEIINKIIFTNDYNKEEYQFLAIKKEDGVKYINTKTTDWEQLYDYRIKNLFMDLVENGEIYVFSLPLRNNYKKLHLAVVKYLLKLAFKYLKKENNNTIKVINYYLLHKYNIKVIRRKR